MAAALEFATSGYNRFDLIHERQDTHLVWVKLIFAINFILLAAFINIYSVKLSNIVQDILTALTVVALIAIFLTGIVYLLIANTNNNFRNNFTWDESHWDFSTLGDGMMLALFAYKGWNCLNF